MGGLHFYLQEKHEFKPNEGKYTSHMDPTGMGMLHMAQFKDFFCQSILQLQLKQVFVVPARQ